MTDAGHSLDPPASIGQPRLVSVIVPCRNERDHVDAFVASVLAQRLPADWSMELLVADGLSDDGSAERLAALAAGEPRLRVVTNPARIVSAGLNRALAAARGEVIVRMDVHTTYARDYVSQCLAALERSGADNVGGPWRAAGDGPWQHAIATAFQSRWVAGGARSRQLDYEGPADTVYLGCWPRIAFERFGNFDETLVRNQDDEHNLRITLGGGRVWQSGRIRSRYRPRDSLAALWRQWLQYGYWKPFVMHRHGQPAALRQLVPGLYVGALAVALALALLGWTSWLGLLLVAYGVNLAAVTIAIRADQDAASQARLGRAGWWRLPAVIAAQQLAYGAGTLVGWWDVWRHGRGRERFGRLTR